MPQITLQAFDGSLLHVCFSPTIPLYEQIRQWNPELFHPMFQRLVRCDEQHSMNPSHIAPMWMDDHEWPFDENERVLLVMSTDVDVRVHIHAVEETRIWLVDVVFAPTPPPDESELMHRFLSFWYEPQYVLSWTGNDYGMYATLHELLLDHIPRLCDFPEVQREHVIQEILRKVNFANVRVP